MNQASVRTQLVAAGIVCSCLGFIAIAAATTASGSLFVLLFVIPAVGALVLAFLRPEWGLILLFVSFYNPAIAYVRLNLFLLSYLVTAALLVVTLIGALIRPSSVRVLGASSLGIFTSCYILMLLFSSVRGLLSGNDLRYVASDLVQIAEPAIAFWVALEVFRRTDRIWIVIGTTFSVFVPTLIWELLIYSLEDLAAFRRTSGGGFIQQAFLGSEVVVAAFSQVPSILLPILFAVSVLGYRWLAPPVRMTVFLSTALSAVSVALSFKRSLWAAETVGLLLVLALAMAVAPLPRVSRFAWRAFVTTAAVVLILGVVRHDGRPILQLIAQRAAYTVQQLEDYYNPGVKSRSLEYAVVATELTRSPLVGKGLGAHYIGYDRGVITEKHFMHNSYLALLYRTGVVGLTCFVAFFGFAIAASMRNLRQAGEGLEGALTIGCLASLSSLALLGVTGGNILMHPSSVFAGVLLAVAVFLGHRTSTLRSVATGTP